MNSDAQERWMYLFERIGEPLNYGVHGASDNLITYNVPMDGVNENTAHAATSIKQGFASVRTKSIMVKRPVNMPDLSGIAASCPRNGIYSYFNPAHRRATTELNAILTAQRSSDDLMAMACACRDSEMINPKVWLNAFASCLLTRRDTKGFQMPAFWEVMPDEFISTFCIKQAQKLAIMPQEDRAVICVDQGFTGNDTNQENKLAYFREDIGINSHHWHWHLIYAISSTPGTRDRKGELFYYMHHGMLARYEAERLANGLPRVIPLNVDEPLTEGYFPKLTDSNSGLLWGNRPAGTRLRDIDRTEDPGELPLARISIEDLRKTKDRILEAIDTGVVIRRDGSRTTINIDLLGDIIESSALTPHPQFYGDFGYHNMGHVVIAFAHDPRADHREQFGPMGDTTTAMRDPVFYRWHKFLDEMFDSYKRSLQPYQDVGGEFPLRWNNIEVTNFEMITKELGDGRVNVLSTYWMQSDIDLSRGLDFSRTAMNNLGPVWARVTHLNHDDFTYRIQATNRTEANQTATVRIFLAPRLNENGKQFPMEQQRKLFFELDKFSTTLRPGNNDIIRQSTESTVTIPWAQTFRELERSLRQPAPQQSVCGCGWPQHMLIPRGTSSGMLFDALVFLTNGSEDAVQSRVTNRPTNSCRESLSFCGILDDLYPDRKPMGYPFDRNPFTVPGPMPNVQIPVPTLEKYVERIPNMRAMQIRIVHRPSKIMVRRDGAPSGMRLIVGDPSMTVSDCRQNPVAGSTAQPGQGARVPPTTRVTSNNRRNGARDASPPRSPGSPSGWTRIGENSRSPSPPNWGGYYD